MRITRSQLLFTLAVLLSINTLNFFDRQVPGAVAEPIRTALDLNDQQLGWITTAFVLLYAAVGMPLGHWADVGRRKVILAGGVLVWSVFTALSGLAWNFWSLFVLRLGVGVGEASCAPAANALLGDLFPRERRGRAIAVFMLGLPLGLGLSSFISGQVAHHWGWRQAFYVAGLPGLVLGLLCLRIPEPARGASEVHGVGAARREGNALFALLRIPTLWWIILSGALHNFNMYALGAFLSPLLQRYHGLKVHEAGVVSGIVYCFGGLGILLGGWACDWMVRRRVSGRLEVGMVALLIGAPCVLMALEQPSGGLEISSRWLRILLERLADVTGAKIEVVAFSLWLLPGSLLFYVYYASVYATIQDIVEPALRGTAMALYFFAMYLLGAAQGPVITGWISDFGARRAASARGSAVITPWDKALGLHDAMYVIPLLGLLLVGVLFAASRTVGRDHQKLERWMAEASAAGLKESA
jgi:MFS family permease